MDDETRRRLMYEELQSTLESLATALGPVQSKMVSVDYEPKEPEGQRVPADG